MSKPPAIKRSEAGSGEGLVEVPLEEAVIRAKSPSVNKPEESETVVLKVGSTVSVVPSFKTKEVVANVPVRMADFTGLVASLKLGVPLKEMPSELSVK